MSDVGSVIAGCSFCCDGRANLQGSTAYTGSIERKGLRSASGGPAGRLWAPGPRSQWWQDRTRAGRSTSSMTSLPTDDASASSTSSTT
jgi:hypothetical protein